MRVGCSKRSRVSSTRLWRRNFLPPPPPLVSVPSRHVGTPTGEAKTSAHALLWFHITKRFLPPLPLSHSIGHLSPGGDPGIREGWGCTHLRRSRRLKTIDPRISTMPGRSTSGFRRPGRHRVRQARTAVRYSASHVTEGALHPAKEPLARRASAPCAYFLACG